MRASLKGGDVIVKRKLLGTVMSFFIWIYLHVWQRLELKNTVTFVFTYF